ncbi:hypothetical protein L3V86_06590 [Thiotrichales bacterium 19S11-10]|nr:hypothetical protein [Thiotrichales bacterium 19S11-10]MCF6807578.1 hypothetical protein [Thiotrichales bacterium 19S9-11]MCF6811547.1 hypothetical protein [Thiotrichales bacterium 19S9-12]
MVQKKSESTHGVFVSVNEKGILIQGKPGVGKSDLALSLIDRGHALIADDEILFKCEDGGVIGYGNDQNYGKIHIRNLGVLDISHQYKIIQQQYLDRIIWLSDEHTIDSALPSLESAFILNKKIPLFRLTIGANRPLATLVEAIANISNEIL